VLRSPSRSAQATLEPRPMPSRWPESGSPSLGDASMADRPRTPATSDAPRVRPEPETKSEAQQAAMADRGSQFRGRFTGPYALEWPPPTSPQFQGHWPELPGLDLMAIDSNEAWSDGLDDPYRELITPSKDRHHLLDAEQRGTRWSE
jgi:hypothetical protein